MVVLRFRGSPEHHGTLLILIAAFVIATFVLTVLDIAYEAFG